MQAILDTAGSIIDLIFGGLSRGVQALVYAFRILGAASAAVWDFIMLMPSFAQIFMLIVFALINVAIVIKIAPFFG